MMFCDALVGNGLFCGPAHCEIAHEYAGFRLKVLLAGVMTDFSAQQLNDRRTHHRPPAPTDAGTSDDHMTEIARGINRVKHSTLNPAHPKTLADSVDHRQCAGVNAWIGRANVPGAVDRHMSWTCSRRALFTCTPCQRHFCNWHIGRPRRWSTNRGERPGYMVRYARGHVCIREAEADP